MQKQFIRQTAMGADLAACFLKENRSLPSMGKVTGQREHNGRPGGEMQENELGRCL